MSKPARALLFATLAALCAAGSSGASAPGAERMTAAGGVADLPLSVMTYNVMGLPWPVAFGRGEALARIADRLAGLRAQGRQPHILLLQEAFIVDPAQFARRAGYAHVVAGPDTAMRTGVPATAADRAFLAGARWDRGETSGRQMGSGLVILSDYPIVKAERMAFPAFACAGFDCLANKGVLIAHLAVPGMAAPVAVVNSHLNARKAAGVAVARSFRAFDRQAGLLADFVAAKAPQGRAVIIGGDFNIGRDRQRIAAFFDRAEAAGLDFVTSHLGGAKRALAGDAAVERGARRDLGRAADRQKDWLFARGVDGRPMRVMQAQAPFGEAAGTMLSDHVGYALSYAPGRERPVRLAGRGRNPGG